MLLEFVAAFNLKMSALSGLFLSPIPHRVMSCRRCCSFFMSSTVFSVVFFPFDQRILSSASLSGAALFIHPRPFPVLALFS